jgi:erythromycin esterase
MNNKTILLTAFFSCHITCMQAQQSIKSYVHDSMVQIKDISPYNEDYSELQTIGDAIGEAKIVMLGEQDHGDAPTFLAKSKIIKYLHEEKGFNVLAFESDFFALNAGWDSLNKTDTAIQTFIRLNIFPLWTACDACQQLLFDYLPATHSSENPLQLSGFDSQIFLWYSYDSLRILLDSVFRLYELPITKTPEYTGIVLPLIDSTAAWLSPYVDSNQYNTAHQFFTQIKLELMEKVVENDFWLLVMDNLIAANLEFECIGIDDSKGYVIRDAQMARNIAWLSRVKYPNEKIIIWAHNFHISKQVDDSNEEFYGGTSMGGFMSQDTALIAQTYVMGFTSYEGSTARIQGRMKSVAEPKRNSFESWVNENYYYGFLDFTPYSGNHQQEFRMKGELHRHSKEAWMTKYDGYFYIRTMYPCINVR